jgi:hypothetical protein
MTPTNIMLTMGAFLIVIGAIAALVSKERAPKGGRRAEANSKGIKFVVTSKGLFLVGLGVVLLLAAGGLRAFSN